MANFFIWCAYVKSNTYMERGDCYKRSNFCGETRWYFKTADSGRWRCESLLLNKLFIDKNVYLRSHNCEFIRFVCHPLSMGIFEPNYKFTAHGFHSFDSVFYLSNVLIWTLTFISTECTTCDEFGMYYRMHGCVIAITVQQQLSNRSTTNAHNEEKRK